MVPHGVPHGSGSTRSLRPRPTRLFHSSISLFETTGDEIGPIVWCTLEVGKTLSGRTEVWVGTWSVHRRRDRIRAILLPGFAREEAGRKRRKPQVRVQYVPA